MKTKAKKVVDYTSSINFFLVVISILLIMACQKEQNEVQVSCEETALPRLHNEWKLVELLWEGERITPNSCIDMDCSYVNLKLEELTYELSGNLIFETENNTFESISFEEAGSFSYEYCHRSNLNANGGNYPGGFTNDGELG